MKKHLVLALLAGAPLLAGARCLPVAGTVQLAPDPSCAIISQMPGPSFTGECYSVRLSLLGLPEATGAAGVTREFVADPLGVPKGQTPLVIPEDVPPNPPRQLIQTARSAIAIGSGRFRTTLFSSDVIVVGKPVFAPTGQLVSGIVTEQIVITGTDGQGLFAGATGHLAVLGNSIGESARVGGEICRN